MTEPTRPPPFAEKENRFPVGSPTCCKTSRHVTPESLARDTEYHNRWSARQARADALRESLKRFWRNARAALGLGQ